MLLTPYFQTPRSLTNVEAIATLAGNFVDHRFSLTFFFVEALTSMVRMFGGSLKRARFCLPKGLVSLGREAGRSDHFQLPKRVMGTKKDGAGRSGRVYFFSLGTP